MEEIEKIISGQTEEPDDEDEDEDNEPVEVRHSTFAIAILSISQLYIMPAIDRSLSDCRWWIPDTRRLCLRWRFWMRRTASS